MALVAIDCESEQKTALVERSATSFLMCGELLNNVLF